MYEYCRTFLASFGEILNKCELTNRNTVQEAMKQIITETTTYIHSMYIKDLYAELISKGVPTTTIANNAEKICKKLPERRKSTLINIMMKWTVEDANERLRKAEYSNTGTQRLGETTYGP